MQKWYRVGGDYGPQGWQYIEFHVLCASWGRAREIFCKRVERDYPIEWQRMGLGNVEVWEC